MSSDDDYEDDFEGYSDDDDFANDDDITAAVAAAGNVVPSALPSDPQSFGSRPRSGGRSIGGLGPQRIYKPIQTKKDRLTAASSEEHLRKDKRAQRILQEVEMTFESFEILDISPVLPSDLFRSDVSVGKIRSVGSQTGEDRTSVKIQTEAPEVASYGCQAPDDMGVGSDDTMSSTSAKKLAHFVNKAAQVCETLIMEKLSAKGNLLEQLASSSHSVLPNLSKKAVRLHLPRIFGQRQVKAVHFSPSQAHILLIAYGQVLNPEQHDKKSDQPVRRQDSIYFGTMYTSLVCVFDLNRPDHLFKLLYCDGEISTLGFSPDRGHIVFAGLEEGSVVLWDLREQALLHRTVEPEQGPSYLLRSPTFSSNFLRDANHETSVVSIAPLSESKAAALQALVIQDKSRSQSENREEEKDGKERDGLANLDILSLNAGSGSFQVASMDKFGMVNIWNVIELKEGDLAGSETDLGLGIGSRVKMTRSHVARKASLADSKLSKSQLRTQRRNQRGGTGLGSRSTLPIMTAHDLAFHPSNTNEFLVALGNGQVIRHSRHGDSPSPSQYVLTSSNTFSSTTQFSDSCTCLSFNPYLPDFFLAAYQSGAVALYNINASVALQVWYSVSTSSVVEVQWSQHRPSVFVVLDDANNVYVFDLLRNDQQPSVFDKVANTQESVRKFSLSQYSVITSKHGISPNTSSLLALPLPDNSVAVHLLISEVARPQFDESNAFQEYIQHVK